MVIVYTIWPLMTAVGADVFVSVSSGVGAAVNSCGRDAQLLVTQLGPGVGAGVVPPSVETEA